MGRVRKSCSSRAAARSGIFVVGCLVLACDRKVSEPLPSFENFERREDACCEVLLRSLNTGIDWTIVLDTSGSFAPKDDLPISKDLADLLRALPLQEEDRLELGFFDAEYHPGESDPVRLSKTALNSFSNEEYVHHFIDTQLVPFSESRTLQRGPTTNIAMLPDALASTHQPAVDRMRYLIVLTDGMHEPKGEGRHISLLNDGHENEAFVDRVVNLVIRAGFIPTSHFYQPALGIFFVVDPSGIRLPEQRKRVEHDWRKVIRALAGAKRKRCGAQAWPVHARLWTPVGSRLFDSGTLSEIGRQDGIYPCIQVSVEHVSGESVKKDKLLWAIPPVASYMREADASDVCKTPAWDALEMPDDVGQGRDKLPLTFRFLFRGDLGQHRPAFVLHSAAEERMPLEEGRAILSPRNTDFLETGWQGRDIAVDLPGSLPMLARFPTPWTLEAGFSGPRLPGGMQLRVTRFDRGDAFPALQRAIARNNWRGQVPALLAALAAILSLILAWWYETQVKVRIMVVANGAESAESAQSVYGKRASYRLKIVEPKSNGGKKIRRSVAYRKFSDLKDRALGAIVDVVREDGPNRTLQEGQLTFDVLPLLGVVYHIAYYKDPKRKVRPVDEPVENVTFRRKRYHDFVALFYKPVTSFWVPIFDKEKANENDGDPELEPDSVITEHEESAPASKPEPGEPEPAAPPRPGPASAASRPSRWVLLKAAFSRKSVWFDLVELPLPSGGIYRLQVFTSLHEGWVALVLRLAEAFMIATVAALSVTAVICSFYVRIEQQGFQWGGRVFVCGLLLYVLCPCLIAWTWTEPFESRAVQSILRARRWLDVAVPFIMYWSLGMALFCSFMCDELGRRVYALIASGVFTLLLIVAYPKFRDSLVKRTIRRMEPMGTVEHVLEIAIARLGS